MTEISPEWIAVDWGTTNLRAFAMQGGQMLARAASDDGMAGLRQDAFEPALARLIAIWAHDHTTPIVACGMVGSRQGWIEAPYRAVPCGPLDVDLTKAVAEGMNFYVISGLKQLQPADVMRGEETQIAGFLALNPGFDGVICLPGTHTKWVQVSAGEVVSFRTFMTGELFALLADKSVLRHSVDASGWHEEAFQNAVLDTLSKPEALAANLFHLRASSLLNETDNSVSRARLSGLLIGAELAASRPYWLGQNIAIIGLGAQSQAYHDALLTQGVPALMVDTDAATLAGLTAAYRTLKETA
ncbi:MAG: 2-dehydro-3-deoxygalactonokinase [Roseobacter sp.]